MERHVCPTCGKFALKQIKSKKNGKLWWICQGPQEVCGAIFPDASGKPDFPQENKSVANFVKWLIEDAGRMAALSDWEKDFINKLIDDDKGDFYSSKQLKSLRSISEKFVDAPEF